MARPLRICPDGIPQHIVNRGNLRAKIFGEPADYLGFLVGLTEAGERTSVRLVDFCIMPNHFHVVLWPSKGSEVSEYMDVAMNVHIRDLQRRHGSVGTGHVYQGRYRNSAILTERHFLNVCRYVEANPYAAGLVKRAEDWRWSSLSISGPAAGIDILAPWPVPRPPRWLELVNRPLSEGSVRALQQEMRNHERLARRGAHWGDE